MNYYICNGELYRADELQHHGIKGQKWGVRRFQNSNGSLTAAGKKRYKTTKDEMDAADLKYYKKNRTGFDLGSKMSRIKAGKEITEYRKAWDEYSKSLKNNKITKEQRSLLHRKFNEASNKLFNVLLSDFKVPSGRTPFWILDDNGERKLIFK